MTAGLPSLLERLEAVVTPFGVLPDLRRDVLEDAGRAYSLYRARIQSLTRNGVGAPPLAAFGFSAADDVARIKCICEGLERFCGVNYANASARFDRFEPLRDRAISPDLCTAYTEAQFRQKDFPFRRFDPQERQEWVPAREARTGREVYVHGDLVRMSPHSRLARASSIGMAVHTSPDLAAQSAALELIERDHLALAFWRGEPCASLPADFLTPELQPHLESMSRAGYRTHCLHLSYGLSVAVVLWMAFRESGLPHLLKGAAAHPDLGQAADKAFEEMLRSFLHYRERRFEVSSNPSGAERNLMHYQTPDVEQRLGFLVGAQVRATELPAASGDIVQELHAQGMPVYLVDMTHPLVAAFGLHCVRAIAPGLARTPLGTEPWQLGLPRLRRPGHARDAVLSAAPQPHFFS